MQTTMPPRHERLKMPRTADQPITSKEELIRAVKYLGSAGNTHLKITELIHRIGQTNTAVWHDPDFKPEV